MRPDIAIRHSVLQVKLLDDEWPKTFRQRLRSYFVREVCAFLNDLFYQVSFKWNDGEWVLRQGHEDEFLPTFNQFLLPERYGDPHSNPYSKLHPEEDRAVTLEHAKHSRSLWLCKQDNDNAECAELHRIGATDFVPIHSWVTKHEASEGQLSRAFLKALWSFWFGLALQGKQPVNTDAFKYEPEDIFPSLTLESAKGILQDEKLTEMTREHELLKVMIEAREFLEQHL